MTDPASKQRTLNYHGNERTEHLCVWSSIQQLCFVHKTTKHRNLRQHAMNCTLGPKRLFPSVGMAVFRETKQTILLLLQTEVSVQGTETKALLAIALAIDKASAIRCTRMTVQVMLPQDRLQSELSFLACYCFFLLWNVQFWCNWWKKLHRIFACRRYVKIAVSSAKCLCFTTKQPKLSVNHFCFSTLL